MATPKIQNAYRNPSSDTEDIADLLLVTTSGLATDGDAGASYIVFHNGTNDVLVSSSNALPVSVSGVATAANQATANGLLTTIDADTGTIATHAATLAGAVSGTEMQVDIVSGTVTVTGVSTLAEQQSQTTLLGTIDADTGNIATSTTDLPNVIGTDGSAGPSKAVSMAGTESGGTLQELRVDADGHLQIDVLSTTGTTTVSGTVDLGATDNAVLDAIAASVASTDGKTPALGQALAAASVPVVLTAAQLSTLTPPAAITGYSTLAEQQTQTTHLTTLIGHVDGVESALTDAVTALQVMDDWDETNRCKVNLIVGQAGVAAGAGAVSADTQRMTLASDDPAVAALQYSGTSGGTQPTKAVQLGYYIDGDAFSLVADTNPYPVRDTGLNDSNYVRVIGGYDGSQVRKVAVNASGYVYTNALMQVGGTVASGNNGTVDNSTQRVTIASDSTGTLAGVTTVTTLTGGGVAHGSPDSSNPVKVGAKAASSLASATLVSAAHRTNLVSDLDGALLVRNGAPLGDNKSTSQSVTDTTSTAATNFGAVASTKNVITEITVYNSSATPTFVKIQDGSGGTTFWTVPAPAGGGSVIQFHRGLKQPTANTALYFAANDSATTVYVSINGYQSKV